jgi:hypothetical protein
MAEAPGLDDACPFVARQAAEQLLLDQTVLVADGHGRSRSTIGDDVEPTA